MTECPSCETKLTNDAKFCYSCGFKMPQTENNAENDLTFLKRTLEPNFVDIEKIGQGGMGSIFLGRQVSLNRKVVIKLLNASLSLEDKLVDNFLKEAQIAANLKHQNIVEMVDYGKAEGRPFFIMEYGEKGSYEKILANLKLLGKKLDPLEVCKTIVKILRALDFAHSKNLLAHLDIKPHNIIIRESGEIFITDFGIALDKKEKRFGDVVGTPEYMSPEQIKGAKDIDARSDVYSTGILFFEMLTSSLPFESIKKENVREMQLKVEIPDIKPRFTKEELKKIEKENLNIDELMDIIRKACEKDKSKRYASCGEMAQAIETMIQSVEEQKTESYKKHRLQILIYGVIASFLTVFILYFFAKQTISESCTHCCREGDCKNGNGKYLFSPMKPGVKPNEYEGEFKNSKKHGYGKYFIYSMKAMYEGTFKEDTYNGTGILTNYNDEDLKDFHSRYVGEFRENAPHGHGSYFFSDGSYFIAEFEKGDPKPGSITFFTKDNALYKGKFGKTKSGTIVPEGTGALILSDSKIYIGEFLQGDIHGKGTFVYPNGKILPGKAEHGKFFPDKK